MALLGLNKDVLSRIVRELGIQTTIEGMPLDVVQSIQPVLISNPKHIINLIKHETSSGTVYTVPTGFKLYLYGYNINVEPGASDGYIQLSCVMPSGETVKLDVITRPSTSSAFHVNHDYSKPVLLNSGSIISFAESNVADTEVTIYGYLEETK